MFKIADQWESYVFCDLCRERIEDLLDGHVLFDPKIVSKLDAYPHNRFSGLAIVHAGECSAQVEQVFGMQGISQEPISLPVFLLALLYNGGLDIEDISDYWQTFFFHTPRPAKRST